METLVQTESLDNLTIVPLIVTSNEPIFVPPLDVVSEVVTPLAVVPEVISSSVVTPLAVVPEVISSSVVVPLAVVSEVITPTIVNPAVVVPSLVVDKVDILYNKIILNSSLLITINNIKTNGFTNATIPLLIMSMITTYNTYTTSTPAHTLTTDDIQVLLERVYNYLVDKYNLIDVADRLAMYTLFDASLTLCLAMPNIKKEANSCLKFFKCF
jgi:hypothetical protein